MACHSVRGVIASTQYLPRRSNGNGMDNTISHHNGDFLQRRLYPFPPRNIQPILNTPSPEMAAHPSRNADGVSHGNTRMRRLRA